MIKLLQINFIKIISSWKLTLYQLIMFSAKSWSWPFWFSKIWFSPFGFSRFWSSRFGTFTWPIYQKISPLSKQFIQIVDILQCRANLNVSIGQKPNIIRLFVFIAIFPYFFHYICKLMTIDDNPVLKLWFQHRLSGCLVVSMEINDTPPIVISTSKVSPLGYNALLLILENESIVCI